MKTEDDMNRRRAAIEEIRNLGHEAVCFEQLAARPLPTDQDTKEKCVELVRKSDILFAIVNDTVTEVMKAEIDEAYERLGPGRMFFYFTKNGKRDGKAKALWESSKRSHILKEFMSSDELRLEVARSIASYLDDVFSREPSKSPILVSETFDLRIGGQKIRRFTMSKGTTIVITCMSSYPFLAGFYSREVFIRKRSAGLFGGFNFGNKAERNEYTERIEISENEDYYFVLKAEGVPLFSKLQSITVEIKQVPE
jgi:hypothetical protein